MKRRPMAKNQGLSEAADQGAVIEQGFAEAVRRDPQQKMRRVVRAVGARTSF